MYEKAREQNTRKRAIENMKRKRQSCNASVCVCERKKETDTLYIYRYKGCFKLTSWFIVEHVFAEKIVVCKHSRRIEFQEFALQGG